MKDDSGSYAVFTEQGSSASQKTAAKVLDDYLPDFLEAKSKQTQLARKLRCRSSTTCVEV